MNISIDQLQEFIRLHLTSILNFNFSFFNPLFWILLFILSLILSRFWPAGKSFSFSLTIGSVLLISTAFEKFLSSKFIQAGAEFEPTLIRVVSIVILGFISLYYACVKTQ